MKALRRGGTSSVSIWKEPRSRAHSASNRRFSLSPTGGFWKWWHRPVKIRQSARRWLPGERAFIPSPWRSTTSKRLSRTWQSKDVQLIGVGSPQVFIHPKAANGILVQLSEKK